MNDFQILLDTWEGSLDIEEDVLLSAGVAGIMPRLNDMNGGHHMDGTFSSQYLQGKVFPVNGVIYFVFNPWVSGKANFEWLAKHAPNDVKSVMHDIEVTYPGYARYSNAYANEVRIFLDLCRKNWTCFIYTGGWFYDRLTTWPVADYCIARYPYSMYPNIAQQWTWDQLRGVLRNTQYFPGLPPITKNGPLPADRIRLWQCSGDRLILPGTKGRPIDVIVYPGNLESLVSWLGGSIPTKPAEQLSLEQKVSRLWDAHVELH